MDPERKYSQEDEQSLLEHSEQQTSDLVFHRTNITRFQWIVFATATIFALVFGILIGRFSIPKNSRDGLLDPSGSIVKQFQHNFTFSQKPDDASEAAWADIIPVGRGFIHHEEIAPFISNIAVFHQLHCLHAIVVAYYDALEAPAVTGIAEAQNWDNATKTRIAIPHIRHCFDYIRQSLMCASDTNLEVLDHKTHTTNGWGQPKTCRDYQMVFQWAEMYANSTDRGIVT